MKTPPAHSDKPASARATSTVKTRKTATAKTAAEPVASAEEVRQWVATAAYYRALQRGFEAGHEQDDWLMAEQEIRQRVVSQGAGSAAGA